MGRRLKSIRLPLLIKDLTEQAAQKRTYVVRFAYGLVLFTAACTVFYANLGVSADAGQSLGRGGPYFAKLVAFQLGVLYLVVPLLCAGAITAEKQRDTLVLLLLTTLTPWQIVVQKFASRMTPTLSFVFLSFPLLAITYTFGGVTIEELAGGILLLIFTCLMIGAVGIMWSAYFRTTAQALIATYGTFLVIGVMCLIPVGVTAGASGMMAIPILIGTGMSVFVTVCCLSFAESVLIERAFVPERNFLLEIFRWLDRQFESLNVVTGGIVLVRDKGHLPTGNPIRWRETRKKSLGTFRYLFRILVLLEVPILFTSQLIRLGGPSNDETDTMSVLLGLVWIAAAILISIHGASLVAEERSHQTLEVLLTCPFSARRILREKTSGVRRLRLMLLLPFFSIFLFEHWWYSRNSFDYIILSALTVMVYLPAIQWLSLWIGLRMRHQLPAMIVCQAIIFGWTAGLTFAIPLLSYFHFKADGLRLVIDVLSPLDMIQSIQASAATGFGGHASQSPWQMAPGITASHFAFYLGLFLCLRWMCEKYADRSLGRIPEPRIH